MIGVMSLDHDACYRIFLARDRRFDGRVFIGVRTTGIYCRPVCPAPPPKQRNVSFYTSAAAAAEAGFRPCLRCRPEVSPQFAAWNGSSSTVTRALRLIEEGALDHQSVETFAGRLGIGARQLHRLFIAHVGAPPTAFAQTRRVHLAKQLVQETNLPLVEVALAAGYGSVRRFNEAFSAMFGRPPASLRRAPGAGAEDGRLTIRLSYAQPYDWPAMLRLLAARAMAGVEAVEGECYRRTVTVGATPGSICVTPAEPGRLAVTFACARRDGLPDLIARIRALFDLAADPEALAAVFAANPHFAPLATVRPGLRVPGAWDGFELAMRSILGERLTRPAPPGLLAVFARAFGTPFPGADGVLTHLFPTPDRLRDADLTLLPLAAKQVRAIAGFAEAAQREPGLLKLYAPVEETIARLAVLPGFDAELAATIAVRFAQPSDDMSGLAPGDRAPLEPLQPWRAYAALHLAAAGQIGSARHRHAA